MRSLLQVLSPLLHAFATCMPSLMHVFNLVCFLFAFLLPCVCLHSCGMRSLLHAFSLACQHCCMPSLSHAYNLACFLPSLSCIPSPLHVFTIAECLHFSFLLAFSIVCLHSSILSFCKWLFWSFKLSLKRVCHSYALAFILPPVVFKFALSQEGSRVACDCNGQWRLRAECGPLRVMVGECVRV